MCSFFFGKFFHGTLVGNPFCCESPLLLASIIQCTKIACQQTASLSIYVEMICDWK